MVRLGTLLRGFSLARAGSVVAVVMRSIFESRPVSRAWITTLRTKGLVPEKRSFIDLSPIFDLSEIVLAAADLAEDLGRRRIGQADGRGKRWIVGAQEGIGGPFLAHGGGNGRPVLAAKLGDLALAPAERGIVGVDADGEAGIGGGIFMAAEDAGLGRQAAKLVEGGPHHRRGALEHAPAAQREQRVAAEERAVAAEMEGDMALGMPGDEQDLRLGIAESKALALVEGDVDSGNAGPVRRRPDDGRPRCLLQAQIA